MRKPGAVGFEWERKRPGAATDVASYLEIAGLGFALTAVAGVLPLVMLLHH